jgi:hypothetical protein
VWDKEHAAMLAEYGEDFADEHRFQDADLFGHAYIRQYY